ncbi:hypothetical protein [Paraburkholderia steynii]
MNVSHPRDRAGKMWTISTDLVVTSERDEKTIKGAVNVKHFLFDTSERRFRALCTVERAYYRQQGATWSLCLSRGLNTAWARNLLWLYPLADEYYRRGFTDAETIAHAILLRGLRRFSHLNTMMEACFHITKESGLRPGAVVRAYRSLLATRHIWTDMNVQDLMAASPSAIRVLQKPVGRAIENRRE